MFLDECKYVVKEVKKSKFITDESSTDYYDKENFDEEIQMKKNKYRFCFLKKCKFPPEISEYFDLGAENGRNFTFLKYKNIWGIFVS